MGVSSRPRRNASPPTQGLPTPQPSAPAVPVTPPIAPPPPFEFAPRPVAPGPYVTPPNDFSQSATGAQSAWQGGQVQNFLSSLPALGSTVPWTPNMTLPADAYTTPVPAAPAPAAPAQTGSPYSEVLLGAVRAIRDKLNS